MKSVLWLAIAAVPAFGHVMSMSSGDIAVTGNRAKYELRMPSYEIAHVKDPERALFEHIRFTSAGAPARLVDKSCREDMSQGSYVCTVNYEFPAPVDELDVECTYHSVTVPNHVHLLRAERDGHRGQAIFDFSFTKSTIRFRPPTRFEIAAVQIGAGFMRAATGMAQVLFLASLVLAARGRREFFPIVLMFLAGQLLGALVTPRTGWQPAPRFVEAAAALTIAYLAVEILLLPNAGKRWIVAGVLGIFHGLYFELFLRTAEYSAAYVLSGAIGAELILLTIFGLLLPKLGRLAHALRPVQVSAGALLVTGLVWFFARLKG
ncbi:MAG: hypothetical protein EXQ52_06520 [Bryobacterales bacterium]|nr:hypothetical protein [Bryobacterales bacterium]